MSDDNQEVVVENQDNVVDVELTSIEQEAMAHGWKPKEHYEGNPEEWRSAELFMALKPFYEKIERQSRELKNQRKAFGQVAKDMQVVKQQAYEKAIKDLKDQRKNAYSDGDFDRVGLIEDQIDTIKERQRIEKEQVVEDDAPPPNDLFENWRSRNTWYDKDEDLRDWAEARGIRLAKGGMVAEDVFRTLEKEVKNKFPEKFKNPNRDRAAAVSGGGKPSAKAERLNMTPEEKRIMDTIVRSGALTEEEYIKQYMAQQ